MSNVHERGSLFWTTIGTLVALTLVAASGCDGAETPERTDSVETVVRDSVGVMIVESASPLWQPGEQWCLGKAETTVGVADGDPRHQLFQVFDATRLSDGTIVVVNSASGELRFFDASGGFIRSVGSTDGGPGEFRGVSAVRAVQRLAGDTILAWDIYAQAVSRFDPGGAFVRSTPLRGPARQFFFAGARSDGTLLMYAKDHAAAGRGEGVPEGSVREKLDLFEFGLDGAASDSLKGIPGEERLQSRLGASGMITLIPPFGRITSFSADGERTYVATGDADQVLVYDRVRALQRIIRRSVPQRALTADQIEVEWRRQFARDSSALNEHGVATQIRRLLEEMPHPDTAPPYRGILVDASGYLWVEECAIGDEPKRWAVFGPEGARLGRVDVPEAFRLFEVGADYVLGRATDEVGVERVIVIELGKRGGCPSLPLNEPRMPR